jgi:RNA polymerase sigma-70 factor (ECF subfamily)
MNDQPAFEAVAAALDANRERLRSLIALKMNPLLRRRLSVDDVLQEVYLAAHRRIEHWQADEHIPAFVRLRTLTLQTLVDLHRRHVVAGKRDLYQEAELASTAGSGEDPLVRILADSVTSPRSRVAKAEMHRLVKEMVQKMPAIDREILELRHFEELSNQESACVLGIEPKAASIRYVRALRRLQEQIQQALEERA